LQTVLWFMKDLTVGKESGLIFKFAMPMLIANLFQQAYSIIDLVIIGNSHIGEPGIAAITNSFHIIFSLIALIIGIAMGFNIIIAQYFGAKQIEKVKLTIDTMLVVIFVTSICVSILGVFIAEPIFNLVNVPENVMPLAVRYVQVYFMGVIAFFGFHGISAILRGIGDSKTPLYLMIVAAVLNIILEWLFIIVLKWGIEWAALATIISQGAVFIASIIYLNKTHKIIRFSFDRLRFDKYITRKAIEIGLPTGAQSALVGFSMLAMLWIINPFGETVIAAFGSASRLDALAGMPAMNFAAALSIFVSQNIGAGKLDRVRKGFYVTLLMTTIFALIITATMVFFGESMMGMFSDDPAVITIGHEYLIIVSSFYVLFTTMFVIGGVLRGAGDTLIPMFITLFALWAVRIPLANYLSKTDIGVHGIWWSIPIAWALGVLLTFLYYKTGRWKKKNVIKEELTEKEVVIAP